MRTYTTWQKHQMLLERQRNTKKLCYLYPVVYKYAPQGINKAINIKGWYSPDPKKKRYLLGQESASDIYHANLECNQAVNGTFRKAWCTCFDVEQLQRCKNCVTRQYHGIATAGLCGLCQCDVLVCILLHEGLQYRHYK